MMEELKLEINDLCDVSQVVESALRNNYEVAIKPAYELYWKTKVDHYEITLKKIKND